MSTVSPYSTKKGRRWEVQWTRPDGRRTRKRGFPTKTAAQAWLEDQNTSRRSDSWVDPAKENTRIDSLGERWLAMQTHHKASERARAHAAVNLPLLKALPHDRTRACGRSCVDITHSDSFTRRHID